MNLGFVAKNLVLLDVEWAHFTIKCRIGKAGEWIGGRAVWLYCAVWGDCLAFIYSIAREGAQSRGWLLCPFFELLAETEFGEVKDGNA